MNYLQRKRGEHRRGATAILILFLIVALLALCALAIDIGYLAMADAELQRVADSAAMAGCWELIDDGDGSLTVETAAARTKAQQFATLNKVAASTVSLDANSANTAGGDIVIGRLNNPKDPTSTMTFTSPDRYNAVQVIVHRDSTRNGNVALFFARIFGKNEMGLQSTATAALLNNIGGFKAPTGGRTLPILPIAVDEDSWDDLMAGTGTDEYRWNESTDDVSSAADGIKELNIYPEDTGSPGNRGTVDIGANNNSTSDLGRQIREGISADDMAHHNNELKFDNDGELDLGADPGISAGIKDDLASIIGEKRVVPIFDDLSGNGNNAQYRIVRWVGVRIMGVDLTGKNKKVIIQPAKISIPQGAIPWTGSDQMSDNVYSPVWLVR